MSWFSFGYCIYPHSTTLVVYINCIHVLQLRPLVFGNLIICTVRFLKPNFFFNFRVLPSQQKVAERLLGLAKAPKVRKANFWVAVTSYITH